MPLDPTIPLQGQAQQNPFAQLGQTLQVANGLQTLKQNQMQLNANQAISDAYSQSLNPDGSVDFNKFQSIAGQNKAGAYLPQFMSQIAQQRNAQQQYDTSKLDMALKQQQNIRGMIGSLALDPDLGKADMSAKIAQQVSTAVQNGLLPLDVGVRELQAIPGDPSQQKAWITNHLINSLSGEAKIQAMMPQNVAVDTGSGTVLLNRNPLSGESTVGTTVQKGLSPSELAQTMNIIGPNGEQRSITKAQYLQMQGGGGVPGAPAGGAPGGYTGRYGDQGGGAPGVQTGQAPADVAAQTKVGEGAGNQLVSDQNFVNGSGSRIYQLDQALNALQNAKTGKGSDYINNIKSYLQTIGVPIDPSKIASYDEANKYLTQYALNQASGLGSGTNEKLATVLSGNASTSISNLAAQDVVRASKGLELMKQAQVAAFRASGEPASKYQDFSSDWNSKVNPGIFVWDQMDKPKQKAYYDHLTDPQRQQFRQQYNAALQNGWIKQAGQ